MQEPTNQEVTDADFELLFRVASLNEVLSLSASDPAVLQEKVEFGKIKGSLGIFCDCCD